MRPILKYLLLLFLLGCTYDSVDIQYSNKALITGYDGRYCLGCCGGLIIYLDDNFGWYNLIENPPKELGIDDHTIFPIAVNVRYKKLEKCSGQYIWVYSMKILK